MITRWSGPFRSLFWRLMLAFGTVVTATLLLIALSLNFSLGGLIERHIGNQMTAEARGVALWAEPYLASARFPGDLRPYLPWVDDLSEGRLWVVDADGVVVADTGTTGSTGPTRDSRGARLDHDWVRRVLGGETLQTRDGNPWMSAAITVGYPVLRDGKVVGAVFLFSARAPLRGLLGGVRTQIGLTLLGAALLALLAAYPLSRFFARPIAHTFVALEEEKQRIHSLIQEMAEGVVAVDEHRRILLVNPAAGRTFGLPGPFDGLLLAEVGFPEPLADALERVTAQAGPDHLLVHFACGGADVNAHVSRVGSEAGASHGAVALLQNVTTELQLRRLRENFVANVSHELRGPLASLSAGVEAMHDGLIAEAARPRYLRAMLSEIARLRRLVDDLLELSRLDAGMVQIAQEEFDLHPLCEGLAAIWEPRAFAMGIQLKAECPHLRVVANYDKVEEALANFLDNALRFTEPGGGIRLFARTEGEFVRVSVADTGVGIAWEHLPHIWDRFYKVDPARTRSRGTGTGLGLAIVKQLAERLGGEVQVQSKPGEGSVFSFTLVAASGEGSGRGSRD